ncbi:unnamed protein product [Caenorhabditis sp. 36 PRJEB53466]|nr:unnamed protein product [Caenorhabditis sp. 36 PRJEB53466]
MDISDTVELSNGNMMPNFGVFTWKNDEETITKLKKAIEFGYRHLEIGSVYGNEEVYAAAIKMVLEEGTVKREDLFITVKIWIYNVDPATVVQTATDMLKKLNLDYVDMCMAHFPAAYAKVIDVEKIWQQFGAVYRSGMTKGCGVVNWNYPEMVRALASDSVPIHLSQSEIILYFVEDTTNWAFCDQNHITTSTIATFGLPSGLNITYASNKNLFWTTCPSESTSYKLLTIARKYGKELKHIIVRHAVQDGFIAFPTPAAASRMVPDIRVDNFEITSADMIKIEENKATERLYFCDRKVFVFHPPSFSDSRPFPMMTADKVKAKPRRYLDNEELEPVGPGPMVVFTQSQKMSIYGPKFDCGPTQLRKQRLLEKIKKEADEAMAMKIAELKAAQEALDAQAELQRQRNLEHARMVHLQMQMQQQQQQQQHSNPHPETSYNDENHGAQMNGNGAGYQREYTVQQYQELYQMAPPPPQYDQHPQQFPQYPDQQFQTPYYNQYYANKM